MYMCITIIGRCAVYNSGFLVSVDCVVFSTGYILWVLHSQEHLLSHSLSCLLMLQTVLLRTTEDTLMEW